MKICAQLHNLYNKVKISVLAVVYMSLSINFKIILKPVFWYFLTAVFGKT